MPASTSVFRERKVYRETIIQKVRHDLFEYWMEEYSGTPAFCDDAEEQCDTLLYSVGWVSMDRTMSETCVDNAGHTHYGRR